MTYAFCNNGKFSLFFIRNAIFYPFLQLYASSYAGICLNEESFFYTNYTSYRQL